jgi:DnaK suppressor protein
VDREAFLAQVMREIEKTEQKIAEYREWTKPVSPDDAIGRLSRMDAINNKSVAESALRQAEEKLRRLHFVTTRIDSPDFGRCVKCQQPIPPGRLLIKPESIHCVRCAQ